MTDDQREAVAQAISAAKDSFDNGTDAHEVDEMSESGASMIVQEYDELFDMQPRPSMQSPILEARLLQAHASLKPSGLALSHDARCIRVQSVARDNPLFAASGSSETLFATLNECDDFANENDDDYGNMTSHTITTKEADPFVCFGTIVLVCSCMTKKTLLYVLLYSCAPA